MAALPSIERIIQTFELLESWEDRYGYIIELGRKLPPLGPDAKIAENRVHGCVSQVWLTCQACPLKPACLNFEADSDALIVRGLIAIVLAIYDGKELDEIVELDSKPIFAKLGLDSHLSPSRANGFAAMVKRIKTLAAAAQKTEKKEAANPR